VYRVAGAVDIPIIGCGGISSTEDAIEFMLAGASAVQIGTANLTNPGAALEIIDGIEQFMKKKHVANLKAIIGKAGSSGK